MDMEPYPHSATRMCNHCDHAFNHTDYQLDSVLSVLRIHHAPEGDEAKQILGTMNLIDDQFERYDPEISRVQGILTSLQERRRSLQWYQDCCRSLLSPIRKLPPEILEIIFLACMGPEPAMVIPVAGQVCRYWRGIVLGCPKLWSNISVGRTRFTFIQRYHDFASLFLERSSNRLLSVSIRSPADSRLVQLLAPHVHRWQLLRLSAIDMDFYNSLGLDTDLAALEKLEIVQANILEPTDADSITILHAPKLRDVVLKNPFKIWSLPWGQLTRVQYHVEAARDGLQLLQSCPQLVECSLDGLNVAENVDLIPHLRPLHNLRFLRLNVDINVSAAAVSQTILQAFFARLTTPNLISLEVIGKWSPEDVTEFISRSECALENLTLGTGYMKDEKIIPVLENVPLLKSLAVDADIGTSRRLHNRVITEKLLRRLVLYPDSDGLLPSLTHLALKTSLAFEDQVLLDVIESRWVPWADELYGIPVSRLNSVDLYFCGRKQTLEPSSIEHLRDLSGEGLRISLQQGSEIISLAATD
ncbi:hypothetical protein C8R44DRAFT_187045 [Mycena epipterygia]|nr:hypothetical protein C8R44DRAFT_187045 [Mycena epipterygia]